MGMLEKYHAINQTVGIAINIQKDGEALIDGCQVIVDGKQLSFEKKETGIAAADICKTFGAGLPVAVNLRGRGVLYKKIEKVDEINQSNFSDVLPNAVMADFYVQHFVSGAFSFVAVIRKTEADKWIGVIKEAGLMPLMLSLGPFPVDYVLPQLNTYGDEIRFDGHHINRDAEKNWINYRFDEAVSEPFILKIENEQIDQCLVIPYAAVFQLVLAAKLDPVIAQVADLEQTFAEAIEERKLKFYGFVTLIVFFVVLLVNFIVLSGLNASNGKLTETLSRTAKNTVDQQGITDLVKQKEVLLRDLGWDGGVRKSIMADHIAALMPKEITLKNMAFNPLDVTARGQNNLRFADGQIRIRGISVQIIPVNEWIARMRTLKWVKAIQMESYNYNNELETGVFTITITY